ncbi:MAG TPA: hypothetical protein VGP47_10415 [Parachlamydiaceae bacterium]|nr:hypothetical protein [Parachlamydiaceae bacterium]
MVDEFMVYKPLDKKVLFRYIKLVGWSLVKSGIDWNLYDENNVFLCSIKISHGKNSKEEVVAHSVDKIKKIFKEKGLIWPPQKKMK